MGKKSTNLIWIDLEMTGLDPVQDRILEIATVVTDKELNVVAEGPTFAIQQSNKILEGMGEWCTKQHTKSGLIKRVKNSEVTEEDAEAETLAFLKKHVFAGKSPMCGNSICMDRRFLYQYMPKLECYFHYRNLDVSTVKLLAQAWYSKIAKEVEKDTLHVALHDIYDSINELKYYRELIFV